MAVPVRQCGEYDGIVISKFDIECFRFVKAGISPHSKLAPHSHESLLLTVMYSGNARCTLGRGDEEELTTSTLYYHVPGEYHSNAFGPVGAEFAAVEWIPQKTSSDLYRKLLKVRPGQDSSLVSKQLGRELVRAMQGTLDDAAELSLLSLVYEALGHNLRQGTRAGCLKAEVKHVLQMLHEDERLTLSRAAEALNVEPTRLASAFKKVTGCTMGEYQRRLRIERSIEALKKPGKTIGEIAAEVGFFDQAHFVKCFKRFMGVTPSVYRAEI